MQTHFTTARLNIVPLSLTEHSFIMELVNTPGWIAFIGDRNVHSQEDATAYIQKILGNSNVHYWVAKRTEDATPLGVVTLIKRDYLVHYDIGFAFLPSVAGQGYAYEAASMVLQDILQEEQHESMLATTIPANASSIRLLEKLGFQFDHEIEQGGETLHVYKFFQNQ